MFSLEGKTALITGADSGIGAAIARCLAEAGSYVFEPDSTGLTFIISAYSVFESSGNAMMRVVRVSGTDITSDDASEFYETSIPASSTEQFIKCMPMDTSIGALVFRESAGTGRLYCGAYNYSTSSITSKTTPTLINNTISNYPHIDKLNSYRLAWVCVDSSNNIQTGVVNVGES